MIREFLSLSSRCVSNLEKLDEKYDTPILEIVESAMKFHSLLFVFYIFFFFYVMDQYSIEKLNLNFEIGLFIPSSWK